MLLVSDVKQIGFQPKPKSAKQFDVFTVIRERIPCCRGADREKALDDKASNMQGTNSKFLSEKRKVRAGV